MKAKGYKKYKASGVDDGHGRPSAAGTGRAGSAWLGEVPEHWEVKRSRFMIKMNPSKTEIAALSPETEVSFLPMEAVGEDGSLNLETTRPISEVSSGYTFFAEGDVTFAKITPCFENGKGAIMKNLVFNYGFGTTELTVIRPNKNVNNGFLFYITKAREFRKNGEAWMYGAGGQKRVPDDFVRDFYFSWPPLPEQKLIASYLDHQTGRIDSLIGKKQRIVELLKEKRTALISRAVTKGLPSKGSGEATQKVKMKPSGVEWLGEVPEGWEVKALRYLFDNLDNKRIPLSAEERGDLEKIYPYYGASGIIDYVDRFLYDETLILVAEDGANLLSRSSPLAFRAEGKYWVNNHAHILRPKYPAITYWVCLLQLYDYTPIVSGSAQPKLTSDNLGSIRLPVPPISEQKLIASYLDHQTTRLDALISKVNTAIDTLKEYRTALISAAVTGKIDVRGVS